MLHEVGLESAPTQTPPSEASALGRKVHTYILEVRNDEDRIRRDWSGPVSQM